MPLWTKLKLKLTTYCNSSSEPMLVFNELLATMHKLLQGRIVQLVQARKFYEDKDLGTVEDWKLLQFNLISKLCLLHRETMEAGI